LFYRSFFRILYCRLIHPKHINMALKITTQIGTDKGITSEAYVRIADYQINKYGSANFRLEIYQTEADVPNLTQSAGSYPAPIMGGGIAHNQQIGDNLLVTLTKQVDATRTVTRPVQVVVTPAVMAQDGVTIVTPAVTNWEDQETTETYQVTVPDMSSVESGTIFAFGYSHLKTKLVDLFGADHVADC